MELILTAAVAVTPLALIPGVFLSHDVIPKFLLLTMAAAILLFLLPRWSSSLQALWRSRGGKWFLILVLAQFVSLVISTLLSDQIPLSLSGTVWRKFGLIGQSAVLIVAVAVTCVAASKPSWIRSLFRAISVCGAMASSYGVLQYFELDPFLDRKLYAIEYFGGIARPPSTMGHALYFSAWLAPVTLIAIASAMTDRAAIWRRIHIAAAILGFAAIVLSATRSAALAVIAAVVVFAWRVLRTAHTSRSVVLKVVGVAVVALLAVTGFIISPAGANLRNRISQWRSDLGGPRLGMWKECPGLIAQHPLFGEGPDTFANEFRKAESIELSRAYPDFYNETPHNALLDAACAQGIPGLAILSALFLFPIFLPRETGVMRIGLDAAILGLLISSMFASLTLVTSLYLWMIVGLTVVLCSETPATEPATWKLPRLVPVAVGAAFLFVGLALTLEDSAWANLNVAVERGNFAAAKEAWSKATVTSLGLPGYELWASREWASLGRSLANSPDGKSAWKLAADSAARAQRSGEEQFSAAYQSSVLHVAASELPRAETSVQEAIRLAPNWYKGHLLLSQLYQYMNKHVEANHEADLASTMGWRK